MNPARVWNVDYRDDGVYVCKGDHHRGDDCDYALATDDDLRVIISLQAQPGKPKGEGEG